MSYKHLSIAGLAVIAFHSSGCSSKKYDSWSECMNEEKKQGGDIKASEFFCNSNYEISANERMIIKKEAEEDFNKKNKIKIPNPKVGDVVDGYAYKGGNPADPNNWKVID